MKIKKAVEVEVQVFDKYCDEFPPCKFCGDQNENIPSRYCSYFRKNRNLGYPNKETIGKYGKSGAFWIRTEKCLKTFGG